MTGLFGKIWRCMFRLGSLNNFSLLDWLYSCLNSLNSPNLFLNSDLFRLLLKYLRFQNVINFKSVSWKFLFFELDAWYPLFHIEKVDRFINAIVFYWRLNTKYPWLSLFDCGLIQFFIFFHTWRIYFALLNTVYTILQNIGW